MSRNPSIHRSSTPRGIQRGGFLLEALVGILIFSLGVLGLVGLQGRSLAYMSDAQYRTEAANLANAYLSRMWAARRTDLPLLYAASGQAQYDAFKTSVDRLPGASTIANNPTVTIVQPGAGATMDAAAVCAAMGLPGTCGISLTSNSTVVTIVVQWVPPAMDTGSPDIVDAGNNRLPHNYTVTAVLGSNL